MSVEDVDEFAYGGQLVFNGIHKTNVLDSEFDFDQVVDEELVDYSSGSIEEPGRGYKLIPFSDFVESDHQIDQETENLLGEVHAFRHLHEEWEYKEVETNQGQNETRPTKNGVSSFDAYWAAPDHLFIKGNKTEASQADDLLSATLDPFLEIRSLSFAPDFLLWIFSKEKNSEQLPGDLSISMLTDAEVRGEEEDFFGQKSKVDDSKDVTKSPHVLMGVLKQKGIVALEGVFGLAGKFVRARFSEEGRVHIKADHAIQGSSDVERMAISIAFLREFTELYEYWMGLDPDRQYPPTDFFTDIYDECERQGVEIQFSIDDVIEEYRQKGGAEDWNQYQSGLGEFP